MTHSQQLRLRLCAASFVSAALAFGLVAAPVARAELRILAPPDGAVLVSLPMTLIGSGVTGPIEVTLDGRKIGDVKQFGKAFTAKIDLAPGQNVVAIKMGEEALRLSYTYSPKQSGPGVYHYHPPVAEGDCKACHPQGVGRTCAVSEARLCNSCHAPMTGAKYLHGPLGAGQCSVCHDPHGSGNKDYLIMSVRALCVLCHVQSRSQKHIEGSGAKVCPECHNPHGSEKKYLLN